MEECLGWLDRFYSSAACPSEVVLALYFHDAIYRPLRRDNEVRSARLASSELTAAGVHPDAVARIARHIVATAGHEPAAGDTGLILDLDLTVLGAAPERYDRFEDAIRREFSLVPEALYRRARRRLLQGFLTRPYIYNTPALRAELEAPARSNLTRCLADWSSRR